MKLVNIDELKTGDIIARSLYYPFGGIMIKAGVKLDRFIITKLKEIGYKYVYVYDEQIGDIEYYETMDELSKVSLTKKIRETFSQLRNEVGLLIKTERWGKISHQEINKFLEKEKLFISTVPKVQLNFIQDVTTIIEKLVSETEYILSILTIKSASQYLYEHSIEVTIKSLLLGKKLGLTRGELIELGVGALLHDIGYSLIPENIVNKKEKLTEHEKKLLHLHPTLGYTILKNHPLVSILSAHVAYQHHEQQNGKGYPRGLRGRNKFIHKKEYQFESEPKIHRYAEIVAVADYYDLMLTDTPFGKALNVDEAYTKLKNAGGSILNKEILDVFLEFVPVYPIGTQVIFTNGKLRGFKGVVTRNFPGELTKPLIKVHRGPKNENIAHPFEVDLRKENFAIKIIP
ncbi:MAG: HD-GYP domain-containing protein [Planctomycetota bacterium]